MKLLKQDQLILLTRIAVHSENVTGTLAAQMVSDWTSQAVQPANVKSAKVYLDVSALVQEDSRLILSVARFVSAEEKVQLKELIQLITILSHFPQNLLPGHVMGTMGKLTKRKRKVKRSHHRQSYQPHLVQERMMITHHHHPLLLILLQ